MQREKIKEENLINKKTDQSGQDQTIIMTENEVLRTAVVVVRTRIRIRILPGCARTRAELQIMYMELGSRADKHVCKHKIYICKNKK